MKKAILMLFLICASNLICADSWTQKASLTNGAAGRVKSFYFSIGSKCYVGAGGSSTGSYTKTLWQYDIVTDTWSQKADFGGVKRCFGSSFSIGNKGYAGLGNNYLAYEQDFWEYDPITNIWTQKANFAGGVRGMTVSFSAYNKGYISTGFKSSPTFSVLKDMWEYDPLNDSWIQKTNLPGINRSSASWFVIDSSTYIVGGASTSSTIYNDVWEYQFLTDTWTQKANFGAGPHCDGVGFAICNKGYVCVGENPIGTYHKYLWQYNPVTNAWIQKTDFPGTSRDGSVAFVMGTKAYVGLGGINASAATAGDFYEYTPDSACITGLENLSLTKNKLTIGVYPNPAKDNITISYSLPPWGEPVSTGRNRVGLTICDATGKQIYNTTATTSNIKLQTSNFAPGIYTVTVTNGKQSLAKIFLKE